jgi:hypothetical protein
MAQDGLVSPVLISQCERHTYTSRRVHLPQYTDDMGLVATSHSTSLLVSCLEAYFGRLERRLRHWRIAIVL